MLDTVVFGNSLLRWLVAVSTAAGLLLVLATARRLLGSRLKHYTARTSRRWDDGVADMVLSTKFLFLAIVAAYFGAKALTLGPKAAAFAYRLCFLAFIFQVGVWGSALIRFGVHYLNLDHTDDGGRQMTVRAAGFVAKFLFFTLIALWALDNVGVNITALVAGIGVGGVAIALATQSVLGDIFASLSIILDKPFVPGDFIVVDDVAGTIENIGLKATRLRSVSGEQVIFANGDLLHSRIRNFKRMRERRIEFRFAVDHYTPADVLARVSGMVRELIAHEKGVRLDRVHFKAIEATGPLFEAVYVVETDDFNRYMDIQERLNLGLWRGLETLGTRPAVPTQRTMFEHRDRDLVPRAPTALPRSPRAV